MFHNLKTIGALAALALAFGSEAHALPLLAENAGIRFNEVLTLYPDSDNPNVFYFMPNSGGIVLDEQTKLPQMGFTHWGLSNGGPLAEAGGYLTMSMRLKSDPAQRAALDAVLAEGKRIAVLPVQASTISLSSTREGPVNGDFFKEFNFSRHAGRAEDEVGVNAIMTGLGAKVFKAAIESPQLMKMDYCYKVQGLGPNMSGTIYVKWDKVYEHFQSSFSAGGWWFRANIAVEIEKLKQNNQVRIELDGGDATEWEKMRELTNTIITRLFVPELQNQPGSGGGGGGWSFSRWKLGYTRREELKEETWTIRKRDLVTQEFCADMAIKDISRYKDQIVRDADAR